MMEAVDAEKGYVLKNRVEFQRYGSLGPSKSDSYWLEHINAQWKF